MAPEHPRLIYGASTIGEAYTSPESVQELIQVLTSCDIKEIDTAALYPWTNIGQSETLLGQVDAINKGFQIDTKILVTSKDGNGTLESAKIEQSVADSVKRLAPTDPNRLHVVHIHAPDYTTPLKDQAATLDAMYKKGLFQKVLSKRQ